MRQKSNTHVLSYQEKDKLYVIQEVACQREKLHVNIANKYNKLESEPSTYVIGS